MSPRDVHSRRAKVGMPGGHRVAWYAITPGEEAIIFILKDSHTRHVRALISERGTLSFFKQHPVRGSSRWKQFDLPCHLFRPLKVNWLVPMTEKVFSLLRSTARARVGESE
ncbi:hypothetical protein RRG08_060668 [Elysia crispata]|uniref:Uncharacterized protein n=1 Tax=Elysia crispata TaxID=231223 RepID=A0AAE1E489_9GAST|nr:hypothetical protein RRG08_060668 [Elysia crispata]